MLVDVHAIHLTEKVTLGFQNKKRPPLDTSDGLAFS